MTKITKVECDNNLKFCRADSPCKIKAVDRKSVYISMYCNLLQDQPQLDVNFVFWSKNSKNIYSVLFNSTENYCRALNLNQNSMAKILIDMFDNYLPGAAQRCPIKVILMVPKVP